MCRIFPILIRERFRRWKKYVSEKPLMVIGIIVSIVYFAYCYIDAIIVNQFGIEQLLKFSYISLIAIIYLILKLINPTQGMTIDYQLIELKLISFREYKLLLGIKLFSGSMFLIILLFESFDKVIYIIGILNIVVNVWVFLRNRWNYRIIDLLLAVCVIICIENELLYLSLVLLILTLGLYVAIRKANYKEILPLYKLTYQIGQRFSGASYSEKEEKQIQTNAENLVGKARIKGSSWCENCYDNKRKFEIYKELSRLMANSDKYIAYIIMSIVISVSGWYLPKWYIVIACTIVLMIAFNFDIVMNEGEAKLLKLGYIDRYSTFEIIRGKLFIYVIVNIVLLFPLLFLEIRCILFLLLASIISAVFALLKCYRNKGY